MYSNNNKLFLKTLFFLLILALTGCAHRSEYTNDISNQKITIPDKLYNNRVALVLGGGGAKGFAHVGVIEALVENNIPIDLIIGTSSGSIIGSLYADNPDTKNLKDKIFSLKKQSLLSQNLVSPLYSLSTDIKLRKFLISNFRNKNIEDLKIPFVAVATSLETNKALRLTSGPVVPAVHSSSALPILFPPVYIYQQHLIDGAAVEPVPVITAKEYKPKIIIAVNISSAPKQTLDYSTVPVLKGYNAIGFAYQAFSIAYSELSKIQTQLADIAIVPDLEDFDIFDDNSKEEIYRRGKEAALMQIDNIKARLKK